MSKKEQITAKFGSAKHVGADGSALSVSVVGESAICSHKTSHTKVNTALSSDFGTGRPFTGSVDDQEKRT